MPRIHPPSAVATVPAPASVPLDRRSEALAGLRSGLPGSLGIVPLGLAFGLLVAQSGLPWWMLPALSIGVFAGSVELLLVSLIAAAAPLPAIALTTLLVNARHVFYAPSFPLHVVRGPLARGYSMYALTDEAYALAVAAPGTWNGPRLVAMQAGIQLAWVLSGLAGLAVGAALPWRIEGLEFAIAALFITLALDACRSLGDVPSVLLAGASFGVAIVAAPEHAMVVGLSLFVASLVARLAVALLAGRPGADRSDRRG